MSKKIVFTLLILLGLQLSHSQSNQHLKEINTTWSKFYKAFENLDLEELKDRPIVVKGCGDLEISNSIYAEITRLLKPVVKSIMYGEPCSTVPVYKKPRAPKN